LRFAYNAENVVFLGSLGVAGKSHLTIARRIEVVIPGLSVYLAKTGILIETGCLPKLKISRTAGEKVKYLLKASQDILGSQG
jgi:DNA replication protein DnaC